MEIKAFSKKIVVVLFGIIFPFLIILKSYHGISSLNKDIIYKTTPEQLISIFTQAKNNLININDYALFSLLYVEHANQKTMINKQVMKIGIVYIGFAVISIGIMLIILGINDGGANIGTDVNGITFDFKTGSTGVVVFLIGSLMSTAGGVLKNTYTTSKIPTYHQVIEGECVLSLNAYLACKEQKTVPFDKCFSNIYKQINSEVLQ